jgi:hypothetical protein
LLTQKLVQGEHDDELVEGEQDDELIDGEQDEELIDGEQDEELIEGEQDDAMAEMPQLPGVKHLTIHFYSQNSHYMVATVSSLLARCNNLEYLHLENQSHLQVTF